MGPNMPSDLSFPQLVPIVQHVDERGSLSKLSVNQDEREFGPIAELLFSRSTRGVIRGFHYQVQRSSGPKLVWCVDGKVEDASFHVPSASNEVPKLWTYRLTAGGPALLLPAGFAHAFECLTASCTLIYALSKKYDASEDRVINYASLGKWWTTTNPVVSDRDRTAVELGHLD